MLLGAVVFPGKIEFVVYPLLLGGVSIVASIIGSFFVRLGKSGNIMNALYKGLWVAAGLALVGFYAVTSQYMSKIGGGGTNNLFLAALVGVAITVARVLLTDFYTRAELHTTKRLAQTSTTRHAPN